MSPGYSDAEGYCGCLAKTGFCLTFQLIINWLMNQVDFTLSALADPTRRQVIELLRERPRRAGELAAASAISGPAMSRHLRVLRRSGLVAVEAGRIDRD